MLEHRCLGEMVVLGARVGLRLEVDVELMLVL